MSPPVSRRAFSISSVPIAASTTCPESDGSTPRRSYESLDARPRAFGHLERAHPVIHDPWSGRPQRHDRLAEPRRRCPRGRLLLDRGAHGARPPHADARPAVRSLLIEHEWDLRRTHLDGLRDRRTEGPADRRRARVPRWSRGRAVRRGDPRCRGRSRRRPGHGPDDRSAGGPGVLLPVHRDKRAGSRLQRGDLPPRSAVLCAIAVGPDRARVSRGFVAELRLPRDPASGSIRKPPGGPGPWRSMSL